MRFYQYILKNVWQRKARSTLTMIGVGIAVTAVVALVGIADGFERSFRELYEKRGVDLMVVRAGSSERLSSSIPQQVGQQRNAVPENCSPLVFACQAVETAPFTAAEIRR